jgi:ketosteroid isomerase-like protein
MTPTETALAFVRAINSKDVDRLAELMTEDHKFIDGDGSEHVGKVRMKAGWKEHFELIPDLTLSVSIQFEQKDTVVLVGQSTGTIIADGKLKKENSWQVPSVWRVVVKSGKVSVWQLYANQCALHEIYERINTA